MPQLARTGRRWMGGWAEHHREEASCRATILPSTYWIQTTSRDQECKGTPQPHLEASPREGLLGSGLVLSPSTPQTDGRPAGPWMSSSPQQAHHAIPSGAIVLCFFPTSAPSSVCALSICTVCSPSASAAAHLASVAPRSRNKRHQRQEQARPQNQRTDDIRPPRHPAFRSLERCSRSAVSVNFTAAFASGS